MSTVSKMLYFFDLRVFRSQTESTSIESEGMLAEYALA